MIRLKIIKCRPQETTLLEAFVVYQEHHYIQTMQEKRFHDGFSWGETWVFAHSCLCVLIKSSLDLVIPRYVGQLPVITTAWLLKHIGSRGTVLVPVISSCVFLWRSGDDQDHLCTPVQNKHWRAVASLHTNCALCCVLTLTFESDFLQTQPQVSVLSPTSDSAAEFLLSSCPSHTHTSQQMKTMVLSHRFHNIHCQWQSKQFQFLNCV